MANRPTIRHYFDVGERTHVSGYGGSGWAAGTYEFQENYPIHFAGATLFVKNDNSVPVVVRIESSADRVTWAPILFSTHTTAGNLSFTLVELSQIALLFTTPAEWVRVRVTDANEDPVRNQVFCYLVEYPPTPPRSSTSVY